MEGEQCCQLSGVATECVHKSEKLGVEFSYSTVLGKIIPHYASVPSFKKKGNEKQEYTSIIKNRILDPIMCKFRNNQKYSCPSEVK